jgi:geranylgeranyl diphosphate synthase type II
MANRALRYAVLTNGHRWRPILLLALIEAFGKHRKQFLRAAAGLEIIHSCTLIVDDLPFVDDADLRRNKPTCHVKFGVDVAVYASNLGFDLADTLILEDSPDELKHNVFRKVKELKQTLVAGQCMERGFHSKSIPVTLNTLKKQYVLKSGAIFRFATELAALCSGFGPNVVRETGKLGEQAGIAYQIGDDIADMFGNPAEIGKRTNKDISKANYARYAGKDFAVKQLNEYRGRAITTMDNLFRQKKLVRNRPLLLGILDHIHHHY